MKAYLNLRYTVPERRAALESGLKSLGYAIENGVTHNPRENDIFVTWNRIGAGDNISRLFKSRGLKVLVTENATWGNGFAGDRWYTIARDYHNTAGKFPIGSVSRWDSLGIVLPEFRTQGETVILPQRGIGSHPVAMPRGWAEQAHQKYSGRIRRHPGKREAVSLDHDLKNCGRVITWGSGAAVKALLMGIPVVSEMPNWIAAQDNTEAGRLEMFRRLAWAQWRLSEITSGEAFEWLLRKHDCAV